MKLIAFGVFAFLFFCNLSHGKSATLLSHNELHKMASTGMPLGKSFQVSSRLDFVSQYYLCNPIKCDSKNWINIEDGQLSTKEKRDLYDLRDKVGCFTVSMLSGGSGSSLYVTSSAPGYCQGDSDQVNGVQSHSEAEATKGLATVDLEASIKIASEAYKKAFVERNYLKLSTFAYPTIVEALGGTNGWVEKAKLGGSILNRMGAKLEEFKVGTPGRIQQGKIAVGAIILTEMPAAAKDGSSIVYSNLYAVSEDAGETWHFLENDGISPQIIAEGDPVLFQKLDVPPKFRVIDSGGRKQYQEEIDGKWVVSSKERFDKRPNIEGAGIFLGIKNKLGSWLGK